LATIRSYDAEDDAVSSLTLVELVELVESIQSEGRRATDEQHAQLSGSMGWGPVVRDFEPYAKGTWALVGGRLRTQGRAVVGLSNRRVGWSLESVRDEGSLVRRRWAERCRNSHTGHEPMRMPSSPLSSAIKCQGISSPCR